MHAAISAVTIQSNKIISNELKTQLSPTRATLGKKANALFGQPGRRRFSWERPAVTNGTSVWAHFPHG